ncbi:helix-turn-helix transcriptional regulator [Chitinophaga horti]|uniref:Helix-turn-helix transcriptional regulator n=1 Tax=Chitinophaga horti TaxID=2920382 RepID=A0ABY6JC04_9BACT|nr:helix-turn-helix domain-containing protein [Chitinophaga horti]UYQ95942.1 helix-turn-helix transcriptional regulator [Chitinophaga horti]
METKTHKCLLTGECSSAMRAVQDAIHILEGRWKVQIIVSLFFGTKRFKEISRDLPGITDKMLSKELKDLETNKLVKRTVQDSFPPRVDYALTEHGQTLRTVISELSHWGYAHREEIMGKKMAEAV